MDDVNKIMNVYSFAGILFTRAMYPLRSRSRLSFLQLHVADAVKYRQALKIEQINLPSQLGKYAAKTPNHSGIKPASSIPDESTTPDLHLPSPNETETLQKTCNKSFEALLI
jgi:hypothetical protein